MSEFTTLNGIAEHREDVKGSIFLAHGARADTPEEALTFLQMVYQRYPDASHLCWAYKIGQNYRFSDGGEPGGTAGQPILRAIEGQGLDHVVMGVIRYFGGTKLGAGGLVRAYGGVAAEALRTADRQLEQPRVTLIVEVAFEHMGTLYRLIDAGNAQQRQESYTEQGVKIQATLLGSAVNSLLVQLRDATRGQFSCKISE